MICIYNMSSEKKVKRTLAAAATHTTVHYACTSVCVCVGALVYVYFSIPGQEHLKIFF